MNKKIVLNEIGVPVVVDGEARPLMPSTFIDWLEPRLTKDMRVFEFGAGNSTLFFESRVKLVRTVEHHIHFVRAMLDCGGSFDLYHRAHDSSGEYPDAIYPGPLAMKLSPELHTYEIVVVDGVLRDACLKSCVPHLASSGVIVLDNSECEGFEGQAWLREQGFSEKVFSGEYAWAKDGEIHQTTVFYKSGNCLGL